MSESYPHARLLFHRAEKSSSGKKIQKILQNQTVKTKTSWMAYTGQKQFISVEPKNTCGKVP
jgi:hypothetical protein